MNTGKQNSSAKCGALWKPAHVRVLKTGYAKELVIGFRYCNIKPLKVFGVQIRIKDDDGVGTVCIVKGDDESQVSNVTEGLRALIMSLKKTKRTLKLRTTVPCGRIIGRNGANVRWLATNDVHIHVGSVDDGCTLCTIYGGSPEDQLSTAENLKKFLIATKNGDRDPREE
ncbi:hypothetical protein CYMTET_40349 [Cymbomonas tetramitiformis]|uniref:K Homology domain-containing protein n=1 Tax=Cymbomonas tetramitiformis TaxID=36881 RepID=A0AAE0F3M7_9CHLO|nr:hypothetical protein CYMTET_40349 [Cymbomonas tetramitiformis]